MPVRLSKSGTTVLERSGKTVKRFSTRKKAKAYLTARNLAHARKRGYKVPPKLKRRRR